METEKKELREVLLEKGVSEEDVDDIIASLSKKSLPAKMTLSRNYTGKGTPWYDEGEEGEEDVVEVKEFPENVEPAHVSATMGMTINLGNYESAKVSVTTTLPCYPEEVEEAYEAAKNFSGKKMLDEKKFIEIALKEDN